MEKPATERKRKPGGGRKPLTFTDNDRVTVSIMAGCGMSQEFICTQIKNPKTNLAIDRKTLEKYFRDELDNGKQKANGLVAQALFKKAIGNGAQSVTAAIFWLKCQAHWKPVEGIEHTGKDGAPLPLPATPMTAPEFKAVAKELLENV
jgi:hypothetical protein